MEFRNQEKSMGFPSSFRYDNHHHHHHNPNQDPRREINGGDDAVLSPSPDRNHKQLRPRRDPDPNQIGSEPEPEPEPAGAITVTRYRECQKNHAAHMGSHVVDGCGEFMAAGDDPLRCAACDCHRNFHRKETNSGSTPPPPPPVFHHRPVQFQRAPAIHGHGISPGTMMAFGGVHAESSSEDLNLQGSHSSRKRFRTKFTEEQKGKMIEMAEKIGWRIQKQDEEAVQRFCVEAGVKRQVFKVWMHNNRQAIKRKQSS